jgi:hypothetical protein
MTSIVRKPKVAAINLIILATLFMYLFACSPSQVKMTIESEELLDSIPSGSGIAIKNDSAIIIGDDATGVYRLDLDSYNYTKISLPHISAENYRQPKDAKLDFECAAIARWKGSEYLISLGSGSNNDARDSALIMNLADYNDKRIVSLSTFYKALQQRTGSDRKVWNIEGATVANDSLFVCNRGNNLIISMPLNGFLNYVTGLDSLLPKAEYHLVKLPYILNRQARLSGICTLNDNELLFCASVEDTEDWTTDGPILGSFVGIYSIKSASVRSAVLLQNNNGERLKEKLESLEVLSKFPGRLKIMAIGDNDNGATRVFVLELKRH